MGIIKEVELEIRKRAAEKALNDIARIESWSEIRIGELGVIRASLTESQKQLFVSQAVEEALSRLRQHMLVTALGQCAYF